VQVPENMAAVLQPTASAGSGGVGEAVIEARRALRSVQDVMHSVVESAQVPAHAHCAHRGLPCSVETCKIDREGSVLEAWSAYGW
jgi:hypothetical protein